MPTGKKAKWNKETAADVRILALAGVPYAEIARLVGLGKNTLPKIYRAELDAGGSRATANVAASLYQNAMKGNVVAQIFWLKTRGGWTEQGNTDSNSAPLKIDVRVTNKGERLKPEDFDEK